MQASSRLNLMQPRASSAGTPLRSSMPSSSRSRGATPVAKFAWYWGVCGYTASISP